MLMAAVAEEENGKQVDSLGARLSQSKDKITGRCPLFGAEQECRRSKRRRRRRRRCKMMSDRSRRYGGEVARWRGGGSDHIDVETFEQAGMGPGTGDEGPPDFSTRLSDEWIYSYTSRWSYRLFIAIASWSARLIVARRFAE